MSIKAASLSLGSVFAVTYVLCVLFGLIAPQLHNANALGTFLPGFEWLTWKGFFIGLFETFVYGIYGGFLFAVLYNRFTRTFKPA
jgi:hypothetical protein